MPTLTINLAEDRLLQLQQIASRLGVAPEELARASIEELLSRPDEDFRRLVDSLLNKNAELYRRLAAL